MTYKYKTNWFFLKSYAKVITENCSQGGMLFSVINTKWAYCSDWRKFEFYH